jgi:predicted nucleic acid-binding Zn ribbon protein
MERRCAPMAEPLWEQPPAWNPAVDNRIGNPPIGQGSQSGIRPAESGSPVIAAPTSPGPISASGADLAKAALAAARKRAREAEQNAAQQPISRRPRFGKAALGSGRSAGRHSGSGPDDRDPQTLQATMGRLLAESGWEEPAAVGGIIHGWADLVGPRIAAHCEPVSFADGVLTVQTDSTAWATELRNLSTQLLARLNKLAVQGPNPPSWRHGRLAVPGRGPRDTYG